MVPIASAPATWSQVRQRVLCALVCAFLRLLLSPAHEPLGITTRIRGLGFHNGRIAARLLGSLEGAFLSLSEASTSFIMGYVTAMLQGHDADDPREESEANDEGIALFRAATRLPERFEETRRHGRSA
jgi:hypothetical protein